MNALQLADRSLQTLGNFDAVVAGGRTWSSVDLHDAVARVARGLIDLGIAPGDRVLLSLPNSAELIIAWRAVLHAGAVTVVAHHDSPQPRIDDIVAETEPAAIITSRPRSKHRNSIRLHIDTPHLQRMIAAHAPLRDPVPRADGDIASIVYTSGTTGTPRGIIVRHHALAEKIHRLERSVDPDRPPVRHLAVLPMSSGFGSGPLLDGLVRKWTVHCHVRFDPLEVLDTIRAQRIERITLVPAMCEALLAVAESTECDLSSVREAIVGGALVPPALVERFEARFGVRLVIQYGISGIGFVSRTSARSSRGSVGRLNANLEGRIVAPNGEDVPNGEIGELLLRRRNGAAVEYWAESTSTGSTDPSAWFATGDLARIDRDGELYVTGRLDDVVIQGGCNIHGPTVAAMIQSLPGVRECAIAGIPSDYLGQEAVACVVLDDGARLTAKDILEHLRGYLEPRATPASVWLTDRLPRNEAGKVKLHELRAAILTARGAVSATELVHELRCAAPSRRHARLAAEIHRLLTLVVREHERASNISHATFRDLGLDSIGAVDFALALSSAIGRPVPATIVYSHPTIDACCAFVLELLGLSSNVHIETPRAERPAFPSAASIRLSDVFTSSELDIVRRPSVTRVLPHRTRVALITGSAGFLGRFLVPECLRLLPEDGVLYCLVRGNDDAAAVERQRAAYDDVPELRALVDGEMAAGRLKVIRGDLTQAYFGLSEEMYAHLAEEVDVIIHNGAVVNHTLAYGDLYVPNVLGTAEVCRLAIASRIKSIDYVSTAAASEGKPRGASGYVETKRTSERLLKELHDRCGVPVRVYRPGWIMAHSELPGQINLHDTLTRLLHGIVVTSLAPRSFYVDTNAANSAAVNGLQVDEVAKGIANLSLAGREDPLAHAVFTVRASHRRVNLDRIIDWVESAGYHVDRVAEYAEWREAFTSRLSALGTSERRRSLLPLLHQWEQPKGAPAISRADDSEHFAEAPAISEAFIHKCLDDMRRVGLIGAPQLALTE